LALDPFLCSTGFCFFALGGVFDKSESLSTESPSWSEFSSSESSLGRFLLVVIFGLSVLWVIFCGAVFALEEVQAVDFLSDTFA